MYCHSVVDGQSGNLTRGRGTRGGRSRAASRGRTSSRGRTTRSRAAPSRGRGRGSAGARVEEMLNSITNFAEDELGPRTEVEQGIADETPMQLGETSDDEEGAASGGPSVLAGTLDTFNRTQR